MKHPRENRRMDWVGTLIGVNVGRTPRTSLRNLWRL